MAAHGRYLDGEIVLMNQTAAFARVFLAPPEKDYHAPPKLKEEDVMYFRPAGAAVLNLTWLADRALRAILETLNLERTPSFRTSTSPGHSLSYFILYPSLL